MQHIKLIKIGYDVITSVLPSDDNAKQILNPLTCIARLAVISFKNPGVKLSISSNSIIYQENGILQGTIRWGKGDRREDLHNLYEPIDKAIEWYPPTCNDSMRVIYEYAKDGLKILKKSYANYNINNSSLVSHSLTHYINIIDTALLQKSPVFASQLTKTHNIPNIPIIQSHIDNSINNEKTSEIAININADENKQNIYSNELLTDANNINKIYKPLYDDTGCMLILKDMWCVDDVEIICKLLKLANINKNTNKQYDYILKSIDEFLEGKDMLLRNKMHILNTTL
jgi:hypothetical protein